MTGARSSSLAPARVVLAMLGVAALPIYLTLRTLGADDDVVTPLGYTWSLSLWIVPTLALLPGWLRRRDDAIDRRALPLTIALLASLGVLLDIVFGNAFFTFPNVDANLRVFTWGYDLSTHTWVRNIPIEEYAFYVFGIAACLLLYVWGDRVWFACYHASDSPPRRGQPWPGAIAFGVLLVASAAAWKAYVLDAPGFPAYFAFLVAVALVPATALYPMVVDAINWRSFSFTILAMFLLSLIWEGTMAVEHGWWGYEPSAMIGIYVAAWGGVPIEEPFLWLLCPYTTIPVYHAMRGRLAAA
jgi:lycopene cyclase domain-containing protein